MDARERALVEAIERGDQQAYLVYADLLAERGDPRAELIALQADPDMRAAEASRFLDAHRDALLGPLAPFTANADPRIELRWHLGFVHGATVTARTLDAARAPIAALFASSSGRFVRELFVYGEDVRHPALEALVDELGRPRTLRELGAHRIVFAAQRLDLPDLDLGAADRDRADLLAEIDRLLEEK